MAPHGARPVGRLVHLVPLGVRCLSPHSCSAPFGARKGSSALRYSASCLHPDGSFRQGCGRCAIIRSMACSFRCRARWAGLCTRASRSTARPCAITRCTMAAEAKQMDVGSRDIGTYFFAKWKVYVRENPLQSAVIIAGKALPVLASVAL